MTTHIFWYLARSSGFLAYLFAWGSVVWGLLMNTRVIPTADRGTLYILHRLLGLGSLVFLSLHLYTLLLDPWAQFSVKDLFVPFAASYRPFWMSCGIAAAYLLIAIAVSSIFQQRLPKVLWRGIHYLSFLTFALGLMHGIGSGTDTRQIWAIAIYAITATVVAVLCLLRILWEPTTPKRANILATARRIDPRTRAGSGMPASTEGGRQVAGMKR
jgi:predicted ferric reductase